jgi:hypothetical protein
MTTAVQTQWRRDTAANIAAFTGAAGELIVDTTNWRTVVQDGLTAGGHPMARVVDLPAGGYRNLLVGNVQGVAAFTAPSAPNTQVKITADALSAYNSTAGLSVCLTGVSVTADFTASNGANALDTGSVAVNTWYSAWVIYNPTTATVAALLSLSAASPLLPSGYTYKMRVGWMLTDGSSHFYRLFQQNRHAQIQVGTNPTLPLSIANSSGGAAGTFSTTSPTLAAVSVAGVVPPTVAKLYGAVIGTATGETVLIAPNLNWGGSNNGPLGSNGMVWPVWFGGEGAQQFTMAPEYSSSLSAMAIAWATSGTHAHMAAIGWDDNL